MSDFRGILRRAYEASKSLDNGWPLIGPTLAICGALLWGSAMVFASMYARLPTGSGSAKVFLIFLGALAGLFVACGAFGSANRRKLWWPLIFLGGLAAGGYCVWHVGVQGVVRFTSVAQQEFVDERREFATSPAGWPSLANTALSAWSLNAELDDVDQPSTSMGAAETDGSAASGQFRRPMPLAGITLQATTSLGIACSGGMHVDAKGVLAEADRALYAAKANGRDGLALASDPAPAVVALGS